MSWIMVAMTACSTLPDPSTNRVVVMLQTAQQPTGCRGVGSPGILRGQHDDPRVAWTDDGRPRLVWPPGFVAWFNPTLVIVDPTGHVVFREGDVIPGGCAIGPSDDPSAVVFVVPPN